MAIGKRWLGGHVVVAPVGRRSVVLPVAGFSHTSKDGGLPLRGGPWRKTVSGVFLNTRWGCVWLEFRRVGTARRLRQWAWKLEPIRPETVTILGHIAVFVMAVSVLLIVVAGR